MPFWRLVRWLNAIPMSCSSAYCHSDVLFVDLMPFPTSCSGLLIHPLNSTGWWSWLINKQFNPFNSRCYSLAINSIWPPGGVELIERELNCHHLVSTADIASAFPGRHPVITGSSPSYRQFNNEKHSRSSLSWVVTCRGAQLAPAPVPIPAMRAAVLCNQLLQSTQSHRHFFGNQSTQLRFSSRASSINSIDTPSGVEWID